jgi:hypothetical protein
MSDYDYAPLAEVDDDVVIIEWDIAVDRSGLEEFIGRAKAQPDKVIVAPYRLYETTIKGDPLKKPVWCHRRPDGTHVDTGERWCSYFGFGLIYFPRPTVKAFREAWTGHFSDGSFAGWYRREVAEQVEIIWEVPAAHLHYKLNDLGFDPEEHASSKTRVARVSSTSPDQDERAAVEATDKAVASLLRERASLKRSGKADRVAAVDEQLALRGHKDAL